MVIEDIIEYKHYEPSNRDELENFEEEYVDMPSVIGLDTYKAVSVLESSGLQVEIQGEGDIIMSQFPKAGERVIKNGIVMIETE